MVGGARLGIAIAVLTTATALGETANANGRFPRAQQLVVQPTDPNRLILRATYGIVTSPNRGQDWFITCEAAVGYSGEEDPAVAVSANGTIFAGMSRGLALSQDACDWRLPAGEFGTRFFADVSVERQDTSRAVALVSGNADTGGGFTNQLFSTSDNGDTFSQLGQNLDPALVLYTLDPAPSDPNIIYVSARRAENALLLRTADRGQTWEEFDILGTASEGRPFIGAVHPTNPDIVFVRFDSQKPNLNPAPGDTAANRDDDFLMVTADGGRTWSEAFRAEAALLGFALSPDGSQLLLGVGDAKAIQQSVDQSALGIYKAATAPLASGGSLSFEKILAEPVRCLTWTEDTIYVCGAEADQGFELGEMPNADFTLNDPSPLTGLLAYDGLRRIVECDDGTDVAEMCSETEAEICNLLQTCPEDAGAASPTGSGGGGGGGSNDSGSCAYSAGTLPGTSLGALGALSATLLGLSLAIRRRRQTRTSGK